MKLFTNINKHYLHYQQVLIFILTKHPPPQTNRHWLQTPENIACLPTLADTFPCKICKFGVLNFYEFEVNTPVTSYNY